MVLVANLDLILVKMLLVALVLNAKCVGVTAIHPIHVIITLRIRANALSILNLTLTLLTLYYLILQLNWNCASQMKMVKVILGISAVF